jgi:hypothetical protein
MRDLARLPEAGRRCPRRRAQRELTTELLVLPDGGVLVHNLTPTFARLLSALNPGDAPLQRRAEARPTPAKWTNRHHAQY